MRISDWSSDVCQLAVPDDVDQPYGVIALFGNVDEAGHLNAFNALGDINESGYLHVGVARLVDEPCDLETLCLPFHLVQQPRYPYAIGFAAYLIRKIGRALCRERVLQDV